MALISICHKLIFELSDMQQQRYVQAYCEQNWKTKNTEELFYIFTTLVF